MLVEVGSYWYSQFWARAWTPKPEVVLRRKLDKTTTYSEWEEVALRLDLILGNDLWRQNPIDNGYFPHLLAHSSQRVSTSTSCPS